ncbi:MAG: hypothetical protein ACI4V1_00900, partial [Eubacteriales bacterium]
STKKTNPGNITGNAIEAYWPARKSGQKRQTTSSPERAFPKKPSPNPPQKISNEEQGQNVVQIKQKICTNFVDSSCLKFFEGGAGESGVRAANLHCSNKSFPRESHPTHTLCHEQKKRSCLLRLSSCQSTLF